MTTWTRKVHTYIGTWHIERGSTALNHNSSRYTNKIRVGVLYGLFFGMRFRVLDSKKIIVMIVNLAIGFVTSPLAPTYLWPVRWVTCRLLVSDDLGWLVPYSPLWWSLPLFQRYHQNFPELLSCAHMNKATWYSPWVAFSIQPSPNLLSCMRSPFFNLNNQTKINKLSRLIV